MVPDVDSGGGSMYVSARVYGNSILSAPCCCEPKNALKIKSIC